jgi:hypothetical protein
MKSIAEALVKFQSQLKPISKDAQNPFFKSDYLTLSGTLSHVLPILTSCELSITQPMRIEAGTTILQTRLTHSSGEFFLSEMILPSLADPQKYGSLITYYKRYQLHAMLGISTADEDDDANSLVTRNQATPRQHSGDNSQSVNRQNPSAPSQALASEAQKKAMKSMGISFPDNVTKAQASELIGQANKR